MKNEARRTVRVRDVPARLAIGAAVVIAFEYV